jgi:hypothetical protein
VSLLCFSCALWVVLWPISTLTGGVLTVERILQPAELTGQRGKRLLRSAWGTALGGLRPSFGCCSTRLLAHPFWLWLEVESQDRRARSARMGTQNGRSFHGVKRVGTDPVGSAQVGRYFHPHETAAGSVSA